MKALLALVLLPPIFAIAQSGPSKNANSPYWQ